MPNLHRAAFDESTKLKLEIFRGYLRKWLPVFLSKKTYADVWIYDFFAGPGRDSKGNEGSPLLVIGELRDYLFSPNVPKAEGVGVNVAFSDSSAKHIRSLEGEFRDRDMSFLRTFSVRQQAFGEALEREARTIGSPKTACLVILDQYGVKAVDPDIFRRFVESPATDVLFFISSSIIRRFIQEDSIREHFPGIDDQQVRSTPMENIHRGICSYYRGLVPAGNEYYLAPFSIRKEARSNIYGVIFGSSRLIGLQKFLEVCWDKDAVTGEANYNIDRDFNWERRQVLLPELNTAKKQDQFREDLANHIAEAPGTTNVDLFRFALESGFLPKHVNEVLRELEKAGTIQVAPIHAGTSRRAGAYYINWDNYKNRATKVVFQTAEGPNP